ncbi:MAG: hypothetical protein AVDCRST_MAG66-1032, partial [uncultured Pseudonocardia sp.]
GRRRRGRAAPARGPDGDGGVHHGRGAGRAAGARRGPGPAAPA